MRKITFIFILLLSAASLEAQEWTTRIWLSNSFNDKFNNIELGVKKAATNLLDENLGEQELPPMQPRGGKLHGFVYFPDSVRNDMMYSYKDYREIPKDSSHYYREYKLWIQWGGASKLTIGWDELPSTVDSAYLTDIKYGLIYKFNMKDSLHAIIDNSSHERFILMVWLNDGNISTPDNLEDVVIYPTTTNEILNIKGVPEETDYEIIDELGRATLTGNTSDSKTVNVSSLPPSMYIMRFNQNNGHYFTKKFIKI